MSVRLNILENYLKEDPHDEFLRYALALEYKSLERIEESYEQFKILEKEHSEYLPMYYMAGKTAEALHFYDEALTWYSKGMDLAIKLENAHTLKELKGAYDMLKEEMSEE